MLIIFDLDDTLVDTSGCLTPIKLEDALNRMVESGLILPDFQESLQQLRRIDSVSESGRESLSEFLEIHNADKKFLEIAVKELYENISSDLPIFAFDGVIDILRELKNEHHLALVTTGIPQMQFWKLKKTGIDSALFSKIVVCEKGDKKPHYKQIVEELGFTPSDVVVCGDRVKRDLTPAKDLGLRTIHIRKGRGLKNSGLISDVDYAISEFLEIPEILLNLN